MLETVHLHPSKASDGKNLFLLFLPAIVFIILTFILFAGIKKEKAQIATTQEPSVLGEESEK